MRELPGGEVLVSGHTAEAAKSARNALAKAIYSRLFDWVIESVNAALAPDKAGKFLADKKIILDGSVERRTLLHFRC